MKSFLILIGASGSGKSRLSKRISAKYPKTVVCSTDDAMKNSEGAYEFLPERLLFAHGCTREKVRRSMESKVPIVVLDNTNTSAEHIEPYFRMAQKFGYRTRFLVFPEMDPKLLAERNLHSVPFETILSQRDRIRHLLANWPKDWPKFEPAPE